MRPILSILTGATCGDNCWHAREEVCRCSCGGVNHGCLLEEGKERPARTCRIQGEDYTLVAVGLLNEIYPKAKALNGQVWKDVSKHQYHYQWREPDRE